MTLLSVIVPVYNVAPYVGKTLASVATAVERLQTSDIAQKLLSKDVEVICVDDGSTDGSGEILDECWRGKIGVENRCTAERDQITHSSTSTRNIDFKIIHQKNAGVSAARNAALDVATGEWVMMLDGDDTWDENLLTKLFDEIAKSPDCDAVGFGAVKVDAEGNTLEELGGMGVTSAVMTGDEVLLDGRGPYSKFIWSSCDKVYRRSVIEKIPLRYAVGMKHAEDSLFSQVFFAYAGKVVLRPDILGYRYYMRSGSAIHAEETELPELPLQFFETLYAHWQKLKTLGLRLRLYYVAVGSSSLGKAEGCAATLRPKAIEYLLSSKIFSRQILPFTLRYGGFKARLFAVIYLSSPRFVRRFLLNLI